MPVTEFFDPLFADPIPESFKRADLESLMLPRAALTAVTVNYNNKESLVMLCDTEGTVHFINVVGQNHVYKASVPFRLREHLAAGLPKQEVIDAIRSRLKVVLPGDAGDACRDVCAESVQVCTGPQCHYPFLVVERGACCPHCGAPYLDFEGEFRIVAQATSDGGEFFVPDPSVWNTLQRLIGLADEGKITFDISRPNRYLSGFKFLWGDEYLFNPGRTRFRAQGNLQALQRYVPGDARPYLYGGAYTMLDWRTCPAGMLRFIEDHGEALMRPAPDLDPAATAAARHNYVFEKWTEDGLDHKFLNMIFAEYPPMSPDLEEALTEAAWDLYRVLSQKTGTSPTVYPRGQVDFFLPVMVRAATPDILMQVLGPWVPDHEALENYIGGE